MKIFLSTDIEGAAGIVDWSQVVGPGPKYEAGRRLLLGEVNAAIDGALAAGATEFVVNDAHWTMQNLEPEELHGEASLVSGRHKPLFMMQGLDPSFDAVFLVAYHGAIGAERATLSHTYNPNAFHEVRLNGTPVGESAVNALVALAHGVPVALLTGDAATAEEARPFLPDLEAVVVKDSLGRFAAQSLHPTVARARIHDGARRALGRLDELRPPVIELPARLDLSLQSADMAEIATRLRGVERTGVRAVRLEDGDPLRLYETFVTAGILARTLVDAEPD